MAIPKFSIHARSISLPSTSHPLDVSIEDHLRKLSASQAGPSSSSSVCQNLCNIKDLYEQMSDLIHLPHNQQVLSHDISKGEFEEVLDGSLALLDLSSTALDALSQLEESILDLKSALRRGSNDEGIHAYLMSRKKISKAISKCHSNLKKAEKSSPLENDGNNVSMLKEAEAISVSTMKSLLSFVMGKKSASHWSMAAKLVKPKQGSKDAEVATEIEEIDRALYALSKKHSGADSKAILKQLETLEMTIHELEDGLESVSRCFVKTRVSLLNVLNH